MLGNRLVLFRIRTTGHLFVFAHGCSREDSRRCLSRARNPLLPFLALFPRLAGYQFADAEVEDGGWSRMSNFQLPSPFLLCSIPDRRSKHLTRRGDREVLTGRKNPSPGERLGDVSAILAVGRACLPRLASPRGLARRWMNERAAPRPGITSFTASIRPSTLVLVPRWGDARRVLQDAPYAIHYYTMRVAAVF